MRKLREGEFEIGSSYRGSSYQDSNVLQ